jgi:diketogulonate reductase-like aldo/keto reductase
MADYRSLMTLIVITSKLWNTFHAKEHVEKLTRYQLDLWGPEVGYFDLFLSESFLPSLSFFTNFLTPTTLHSPLPDLIEIRRPEPSLSPRMVE